ncbi:MAG: hypothetical protein HYS13_04520 [Planctomycetia bacterium]|nr:hypothetical protein [Planctomycetia bacterium]
MRRSWVRIPSPPLHHPHSQRARRQSRPAGFLGFLRAQGTQRTAGETPPHAFAGRSLINRRSRLAAQAAQSLGPDPVSLYTPLFVLSRVTGWSAHVIEQLDNNRIIRPRARYTGPGPRKYVAVEKR